MTWKGVLRPTAAELSGEDFEAAKADGRLRMVRFVRLSPGLASTLPRKESVAREWEWESSGLLPDSLGDVVDVAGLLRFRIEDMREIRGKAGEKKWAKIRKGVGQTHECKATLPLWFLEHHLPRAAYVGRVRFWNRGEGWPEPVYANIFYILGGDFGG